MTLDPSTFSTMTPQEFSRTVAAMSDRQVEEIMGGEHRRTILDAIFRRFPSAVRADRTAGVHKTVDFRVTGGPGESSDTYRVTIDDGAARTERDPSGEPDASLMLGPVELAKVLTGRGNPTLMVVRGKIKVRGDLGLAKSFSSYFSVPKG